MSQPPISDAQTERFMAMALSRAGADELMTPREIIRDFLTLLHILKDNPTVSFEEVIRGLPSETQHASAAEDMPAREESTASKNKINIFDIEV